MIRVLHSVSNMDRAGIETMLMNYYRHMDRTKVQFDFLNNKSKPGDYDEEVRMLGGRSFHGPGLSPAKRPAYMRFMKQLLKENPDIVILHAHNEAMAEYALEGAHCAGLPVRIFHAHNTRIDFDYKWPIKVLCKQFLRLHYTDQWACGRDAGAFYFSKKEVENGKVLILHNAIEPERFAFSAELRESIREKCHLEGKYVIGHVGRLNHQKNHGFLLKAFCEVHRQIPVAHLLLIGTGELEEEIRGQIEKYQLKDAVTMTGLVSNPNEWYSAMDVFVLPSLFEGLPVVGIEAQANGLRCVFSDHVTMETDISGRCDYLPLRVKAWSDRLIRLKNSDHLENMYDQVTKHGYNIEVEAKKLTELYLGMADGGEINGKMQCIDECL